MVRTEKQAVARRGFLAGSLGLAAVGMGGCAVRSTEPFADQSLELPSDPVRLSWMAQRLPSSAGGDLRKRLTDTFTEEYPNIAVSLIDVPAESDVRRGLITSQIAAGSESPDVFLGDVVWPAQLAANALAAPLGTKNEDEEFWGDFPEMVVKSLTYDGQLWAYPFFIDVAFLYYRTDLLRAGGFDVPRTWQDVEEISHKVVEADRTRYGFVWQGISSEALTCSADEYVADFGGAFLKDGDGRVAAESPQVTNAIRYMSNLVRDGVSPKAVSTYAPAQSMTAFAGGQAMFLRNWSYAWGVANSKESSSVAGNVGVIPRPTIEGSGRESVSTMGGWHSFVNPNSLHGGAALAFAKWLSGARAQRILGTESSYTPSRRSVLTSAEVIEQDNPTFRLAAEMQYSLRPTQSQYYPQISQSIYTNTNPVIANPSASVTKAVESMADDLQLAKEGLAL
ncbi:type 2 periplasmic-binding domain-containing protein [Arthrobacter pigmenti]